MELAGRGFELKGEIALTVVRGSHALGACLPPPRAGAGEQPCSASTREKASRVTLPSKAASPRLTLLADGLIGSGSLGPCSVSMRPCASRSGSCALRSSVRTCAASSVPGQE